MSAERSDIREHLVAYLDGELHDEVLRLRIERALTLDPELRREAQRLRESWRLLGAAEPAPAVREDFTRSVVARARRELLQPARRGPAVWPLVVAASVLASLALWWLMQQGAGEPPSAELESTARGGPAAMSEPDLEVVRSLHLLEDLEWLEEQGHRLDLGYRLEMLALVQAQFE